MVVCRTMHQREIIKLTMPKEKKSRYCTTAATATAAKR